MKAAILSIIDAAICFAQKTWRPLVCYGVAVTMVLISVAILVNAIILPLKAGTPMDLGQLGGLIASLAALVGSLFPFVWARSYEKVRGIPRDRDPPF